MIKRYTTLLLIGFVCLISACPTYARTTQASIFPQATGLSSQIVGTKVNVRQAPALDARILMQTNTRDVKVTGKNKAWYQVNIQGREGWVHADFMHVDRPELVPYAKVLGEEVVSYGMQFIGTPYVWGGNDLEEGIDCSGLMKEIFEPFDVELSRVSYLQAKDGQEVAKHALRTGDLVFFDTQGVNDGKISHVGIYVGDDKFLHADGTKGVMISTLNSNYYTRNYVKAVRVC